LASSSFARPSSAASPCFPGVSTRLPGVARGPQVLVVTSHFADASQDTPELTRQVSV